MKTVVFAYHTMGVIGLQALIDNGFTVDAIFSHLDDPREKCWFESVAAWAEKNEIQIFFPDNVNEPEWIKIIEAISPDIIFSFYYRRLLCKQILAIPQQGAFNLHGSLLPSYRGRCPVNWVLVNGETKTGVTLHYMVEQADAGDIVAQTEVAIDFEDTAKSLFEKLNSSAKSLLDETLPLIKAGSAPRIKQDIKSGSCFGRRGPKDGKIDWNRPVNSIHNLIRAVTAPYPGAFTILPDGRKMIVWKSYPEEIEVQQNLLNGSFIIEGGDEREGKADREKVFVKTPDGRLELLTVEIEGNAVVIEKPFEIFKNISGAVLT